MPFSRARFVSYRNLEDGELDLGAERIFLIGENGQGKTNFLEALYYLCYGASFRGAVDQQIPAAGASGFGLSASWKPVNGLAPAGIEDGISIRYDGQTKDIRLNGKSLKDRKELVFHNPAVVFCHEDFSFAAGDPERRRFFFDQCAGMLSPTYIDTLRSYKRVLRQRNAALKESAHDLLDVLDPQLIGLGLRLMEERSALFLMFHQEFSQLYEYVSHLGRPVEISYSPSWQKVFDFQELADHLARRRDSEILYGTTRSGPHRDRWDFVCMAESFTDKASTGQLRLLSLILRIIEAKLAAGNALRWPILLLDDVLLELDVGKRRRFLELLPPSDQGAQAFFTFLPEEPWTEYEQGNTLVYKVYNGRFENQKRL